MKKLREKFRRDRLLYSQIDKNDFVGLYSVGGHFSDKTTHYEVCKIYIRNDIYGEREALPTDALFGEDLSRCFPDMETAQKYFVEMTQRYNNVQKMPKVVTVSEESTEVIPESQFQEI